MKLFATRSTMDKRFVLTPYPEQDMQHALAPNENTTGESLQQPLLQRIFLCLNSLIL